MRSSTFVAVVLALLIGLTIGWGSAKAATNAGALGATGVQSVDIVNNTFNSPSTNTRVSLNNLLREHAVLGGVTLTALYAGADTTQLMKLMQDNTNKLGSLVQQEYGTTAKDTFINLWNQHMKEYQNYTLAKKSNDTAKMDSAKNNLKTISTKLGQLLATPHMSANTISSLMTEHANGTLSLVDAVAKKDSTASANWLKKDYDQAGKFADTLSRGIIQDKLSK